MNLKNIFDKNGNLKGIKVIQKHFVEEYRYILESTNFLNPNEKFRGRIYFLKNKLTLKDIQCLNCGKILLFKDSKLGFGNYCNSNCSETCSIKKENTISTNFRKYGIKWSSQSDAAKLKRESTVIKKFGSKHIFSNSEIQKKIQDINLKRIGVKYPFQSKIIQEEIQDKKRLLYPTGNNTNSHISNYEFWSDVNFWKENFLTENNNFDLYKCMEYFNCKQPAAHTQLKLLKISYTRLGGTSLQEQKIIEYLQSELDLTVEINRRDIISPLELDIYLPELNLAIEYNGSYWHSYHPTNGVVSKQNDLEYCKFRHQNKTLLCLNLGIRLLHLYEKDNFEFQKLKIFNFIMNETSDYELDNGCYPLNLDGFDILEPEPWLIEDDRLLFNSGYIKEKLNGKKI
jgi:hypothetical protein